MEKFGVPYSMNGIKKLYTHSNKPMRVPDILSRTGSVEILEYKI